MMDTREKIMENAFQIFATKGYSATSMQDILNASGTTKGGFYHHFKSKQALFEELLNTYFFGLLNGFFDQFVDIKGNTKEKLLMIFNATNDVMENFMGASGEFNPMYMHLIMDAIQLLDTTQSKITEMYDKMIGAVSSIIEAGKEAGDIKDSLDSEAIAFDIIAFMEGALFVSIVTGKYKLKTQLDKKLNLLWSFISREEA